MSVDETAANLQESFVPADKWESWATDLEIDRMLEAPTMNPNDPLCICGHRESIHYGQGSCRQFAVCECPQFDEYEDADTDDDEGYR